MRLHRKRKEERRRCLRRLLTEVLANVRSSEAVTARLANHDAGNNISLTGVVCSDPGCGPSAMLHGGRRDEAVNIVWTSESELPLGTKASRSNWTHRLGEPVHAKRLWHLNIMPPTAP